jgi:O-antigen ligase
MKINKIENFLYNIVPFWLTVLLPIVLVTGPFLSNLTISLCSLIFIINCYRNNIVKYFKSSFFKYFVFFTIILIISSIFSNYPFHSLKSSLFYIRFGIFSLLVWYLLDTNKNFIKYIFFILSLTFFFLIFDGIIQFFFNKNLIGMVPTYDANGPRISSFFGNEVIMGSYLVRLFPIFLAILFVSFYKKKLFPYTIFFFVFIEIIVFLTGERTSFFLLNLSMFYIFININGYTKLRISLPIIFVIIFSILLYLKPEIGNRMIKYSLKQMGLLNNSSGIVLFSHMHTGHYKISIKMFLENKILGVGPRNFRKECLEERYNTMSLDDAGVDIVSACTTHPHNTYFQLLAETGFVGFIYINLILFYFIYLTLKNFFMKIKNKIFLSNFEICILGAFLITLWPLAPSGNFFNNYLSIFYYFPIGFYLWFRKKN